MVVLHNYECFSAYYNADQPNTEVGAICCEVDAATQYEGSNEGTQCEKSDASKQYLDSFKADASTQYVDSFKAPAHSM